MYTLQDAHKSTLMDMEIADYERLVKELNQKITDKDSRIEDLEQEAGIQKQKQETLQEEISELSYKQKSHYGIGTCGKRYNSETTSQVSK